MAQTTCSVEGCDAHAKARGWCSRHYHRWWRNGDPLTVGTEIPQSPTCLECGDENPPATANGLRPAYCSRKCRNHASYMRRREDILAKRKKAERSPKSCAECGEAFTPERSSSQIFCSKACGARSANATWRAGRGQCQRDECTNAAISRGLCRRHHPTASTWSRGTPEARQINLRRKTQQRRARLKGDPDAELIDRDDIGDRDGWRCGLCAKTVDRTLPYPHLKSASLDHIVPLSVGGKHVLTNVQIAHFDCNMAKGNRGGGEQLLLVG